MDELFESFGLVRKLVNLPQPVSVFSGDMAPTADFERRDRRLVRVVDVRLEVSIPIGLQLVFVLKSMTEYCYIYFQYIY